jgi:serine/threonine-protein kinase
MGSVYVAFQRNLGRHVALKAVAAGRPGEERLRARFFEEARIACQLCHPNTIRLHDFGSLEDGGLYYTMELVDGETLRDLMEREAPLAPARAVAILVQVCDALTEAHDKGLIHRDVKPENVMIAPMAGCEEFVKVVDFGLARAVHRRPGMSLTQAGKVAGSPHYMSPEQAMNRQIDARSDIYSLGIIAYEMLSGEVPFDADSDHDVLAAHVRTPPPPLRERFPDLGVPAALDRAVLSLLEKRPEARPASASEARERLLAASGVSPGGPGARARLALAAAASRAGAGRRGQVFFALAAVAAALVAAVAFLLASRGCGL